MGPAVVNPMKVEVEEGQVTEATFPFAIALP